MARSGIRLTDLGFERPYRMWSAYAQSKLANILFSNELARRLPDGQSSNALHTGLVDTALWRHMSASEIKSMTRYARLRPPEECAATICYLAAHPDAQKMSACYISNGVLGTPTAIAHDKAHAAELWNLSEDIKKRLRANIK